MKEKWGKNNKGEGWSHFSLGGKEKPGLGDDINLKIGRATGICKSLEMRSAWHIQRTWTWTHVAEDQGELEGYEVRVGKPQIVKSLGTDKEFRFC